jgi:hypothetical protein
MALLLAALAPSLSLASEDAALRTEIEKMLLMTRMDQMMEPMYAQLEEMLQSQIAQMGVSEEQQPIVEKYNKEVFELVRNEMAWEKMRDQYIDLYAKVYSLDEIKAISEFYRSEVGQKTLAKMPQLVQESMTLANASLQALFPQMQQLSQQMIAEIQAAQQ